MLNYFDHLLLLLLIQSQCSVAVVTL